MNFDPRLNAAMAASAALAVLAFSLVADGRVRTEPMAWDVASALEEGDILRVVGSDGYDEEFGYLNVYPDDDWLALQGEMILAMEYEGAVVPDWDDGPRLVFLAPDGLYSNSDCEATSYEDQGYHLYPSAGARWVRLVVSIVVEAGT